MLVSFSSCGTYNSFSTYYFEKINDLSELNGTYLNEEVDSISGFLWGSHENSQMLTFFGCLECIDEDIETAIAIRRSIDSVTVQFPDDHTLLASYSVNDTVLSTELKGEKKGNYFEIYFHKKQFIIPLIYGKVSVDRLRIGRYKNTNNLYIRNYNEQLDWFLIIAGGNRGAGEKSYLYKKTSD